MVVNVDRYGNTSSGSIPLALADAADDGRLATGQAGVDDRDGRGPHVGLGADRMDAFHERSHGMTKIAFMFPGQGSFEAGHGPRDRRRRCPRPWPSTTRAARRPGSTSRALCFDGPAEELIADRGAAAGARRHEPRHQRGAARARHRPGLRRRPFRRRVLGARRRRLDGRRARRSRSCASAGSRWPRRRRSAPARWPRSSASPTRSVEGLAARSTTCGRRTTTAPASSSSRARRTRSTRPARRRSTRARAARSGCSVSGAFHSPFVARAADRLRPAIDKIDFKVPTAQFMSTVTAQARGRAALSRAARRAADGAGAVHAGRARAGRRTA